MQIRNNQQQNFGRLRFQGPKIESESVSYIMDVILRRKGIQRQILNHNLGIYAIDSTSKNEALLFAAFDRFGMSPQFISKKTGRAVKPPKYKISEEIQKAMRNRLTKALEKHLDRMS